MIEINNRSYLYFLTLLLAILILFNVYSMISTGNLFGILPITIQLGLAYLLYSKSKFTPIGFKLWASIFLILGSFLKLIGLLFSWYGYSLKNANYEIDIYEIIKQMIILFVGAFIYFTIDKNIKIITE